MDVGPQDERLDGDVSGRNIVVLRSFGKFFGLAGVRVGFAICDSVLAATLRDRLGPWAVSGPALTIGCAALGDLDWQAAMRAELLVRAGRLDALLANAGFTVEGGTSLYRYVRSLGVAGAGRAGWPAACGAAAVVLALAPAFAGALVGRGLGSGAAPVESAASATSMVPASRAAKDRVGARLITFRPSVPGPTRGNADRNVKSAALARRDPLLIRGIRLTKD